MATLGGNNPSNLKTQAPRCCTIISRPLCWWMRSVQCDSSATPLESVQQEMTTTMQFTFHQMTAPIHHTTTIAQIWATSNSDLTGNIQLTWQGTSDNQEKLSVVLIHTYHMFCCLHYPNLKVSIICEDLVGIVLCHRSKLDSNNVNNMQHFVTCCQHYRCDFTSSCVFVTSQHVTKTDNKIHHLVVYLVICSLLRHDMQQLVTCCKHDSFSHKICMSPMSAKNSKQTTCCHNILQHVGDNSN